MRAVPEEEEDEERASPTTIITIATTAQAPTVDNCACQFLLWQENVVNVPITSHDHPFGCPIIYTDTIHNAILFTDTLTIFDTTTVFINGDAMFDNNC